MPIESQETNSADNSDLRYLPRWEVKSPVSFQSQDYTIPQEGQTKDLSCAGVCFFTAINLNQNQKIKLTIYLSPPTVIRVDGVVVWVKPADGMNQVGVTFYNVNQKTQDLILEHAFEFNHKEVFNRWFSGWDKDTSL